jgi:hypothetical protein
LERVEAGWEQQLRTQLRAQSTVFDEQLAAQVRTCLRVAVGTSR